MVTFRHDYVNTVIREDASVALTATRLRVTLHPRILRHGLVPVFVVRRLDGTRCVAGSRVDSTSPRGLPVGWKADIGVRDDDRARGTQPVAEHVRQRVLDQPPTRCAFSARSLVPGVFQASASTVF